MKDIAGFLEGYLMPRVYHREKIITVSESSKADIIAMKPLQNKNVSVVNPGISLPELKLFPKKSTSPTLVYVGRVRPYKNIDVAIMAFEKVLVEFPDAVFKIAGSGESVPHLKKLVKERGLGKSVKFYGHVTDELREKLYKSAWLMIQPSTMEGWGITVIEANSCATPVIASNVSGLKDSVIDGKTGILVPPGNIDLFAKGIVKIFKNNSLRRKMALASVDRAKEFGWTNNASEFLSEIKKDLKSRYNFALGGISE
jgi:glycosyltransferase involved in cell wall biosynthesis